MNITFAFIWHDKQMGTSLIICIQLLGCEYLTKFLTRVDQSNRPVSQPTLKDKFTQK